MELEKVVVMVVVMAFKFPSRTCRTKERSHSLFSCLTPRNWILFAAAAAAALGINSLWDMVWMVVLSTCILYSNIQ